MAVIHTTPIYDESPLKEKIIITNIVTITLIILQHITNANTNTIQWKMFLEVLITSCKMFEILLWIVFINFW